MKNSARKVIKLQGKSLNNTMFSICTWCCWGDINNAHPFPLVSLFNGFFFRLFRKHGVHSCWVHLFELLVSIEQLFSLSMPLEKSDKCPQHILIIMNN